MIQTIRTNPKVYAAVRKHLEIRGPSGLMNFVASLLEDEDGASTPDGVWIDDRRIDWNDVTNSI